MKFGETLYQRSVPKWAPYNVNYNHLKHLIKSHTSNGTGAPISIPTPGVNRWQQLEDDLYRAVKEQYDNVSLFLRSKQGEYERRLVHLEKQVRIAQRAVNEGALDKPILQARKYQRLVSDAESIGDEIEDLSRFAGVQKTAFRKILKKYRKWTGSSTLIGRLDGEVFSSGALEVDYADLLQRLATQSKIISEELATPMLTGRQKSNVLDRPTSAPQVLNRSNAPDLNQAATRGPMDLDAAMSTVPYGEVAGSAFYWIHPDNFQEAEALLLRHMQTLGSKTTISRGSSTTSFSAQSGNIGVKPLHSDIMHNVYYDNVQRFTQDVQTLRPSRIALDASWCAESEAVVVLSSLAPKSAETEILKLRRKDVGKALQRHSQDFSKIKGSSVRSIYDYLGAHRDVKPLAYVGSTRSRYCGITNSPEVGTWATLDSSISIAPVDTTQLGQPEPQIEAGDSFPHAVLHIRWEFTRMPEVVRAFDNSHLAERVQNFTLENAAIYTVVPDLAQPSWRQLLERDIRKVPTLMRNKRVTSREVSSVPNSSGPSSTDGPSDGVFSPRRIQSSVTSDEIGAGFVTKDGSPTLTAQSVSTNPQRKKKKHARVVAPSRPEPVPERYWNEFDDGDSETHMEEAYAIYIDPNEPSFPGAETVSKAFGSMYESFSRGKNRVISWLPLKKKRKTNELRTERTPLLFGLQGEGHISSDADPDLSSSEGEDFIPHPPQRQKLHKRTSSYASQRPVLSSRGSAMYRPHQQLSHRQRALERTLFQFYIGLMAVSYMFLLMSFILLGTGRKKKVIEVDAGVLSGVIAAEICVVMSGVLLCMRRQPLSALHWGLMGVNMAIIVVAGVAIISSMFAGR